VCNVKRNLCQPKYSIYIRKIFELTSIVDEAITVLLGRPLGDLGPALDMLLRVLGLELRDEVLVKPFPSMSISSISTSALLG